MAIQISRMQEGDIDGAVDCVQKAFAEDPYNKWVFDDRAKFSLARNRVSLGIRCRWGIQHGLFYVARDSSGSDPSKVLGMAMWLAPSNPFAPQSWSEYMGSWSLWFQQLYMNAIWGRGGLNVKRYWLWKASQAKAQADLWTDENGYYFCNIVTVLPEAQGKGIGKELFGVVINQADREGRRCYLESSRAEPNMKIYERMGFVLKKEMECDDDGDAITLYCMTREPQST